MVFLKITQTNGTFKLIPDNYVVSMTLGAPTTTGGSYAANSIVVRGKITACKYLDGANAASPTITAATVTAYDGSNELYQYGTQTVDGAFNQVLSN